MVVDRRRFINFGKFWGALQFLLNYHPWFSDINSIDPVLLAGEEINFSSYFCHEGKRRSGGSAPSKYFATTPSAWAENAFSSTLRLPLATKNFGSL